MIRDSAGGLYVVIEGVALRVPPLTLADIAFSLEQIERAQRWDRFRGIDAQRSWRERFWDWFTKQTI